MICALLNYLFVSFHWFDGHCSNDCHYVRNGFHHHLCTHKGECFSTKNYANFFLIFCNYQIARIIALEATYISLLYPGLEKTMCYEGKCNIQIQNDLCLIKLFIR